MSGVYCKHNKIIFLHIAKTGGTSLSGMFRRHPFFKSCKIFDDHKTISEFKKIVPTSRFKQCFKFTCVRNPFSMLVSLYNFILQNKNAPDCTMVRDGGFGALVKNFCDTNLTYFDYIEHDGKNLMNFIIKLENIEEDTHTALKMIDEHIKSFRNTIPIVSPVRLKPMVLPTLEHHNVGMKTNFLDYYSDGKIIDMVRKKFERELTYFNYDLE